MANMFGENNKIFYTSPVPTDMVKIRIDKFIASEIPDFSRSQVQRLIEEGYVFADDESISDKNFKTRLGDVYQITLPEPTEAKPLPENIPLKVLYEDSDLIVVNKPAGMTVHPAAGINHGTLVNALLYHCHGSLSGIGGVARPGIVHRIDKNTSGILVIAKNDIAHRGLAEQFFFHSIERTYYAVCYNVPSSSKGVIEGNIARSSFDRKKMALVSTGGKTAITHYEVVENYRNAASLIKCHLETGRTHQIRVHFSSIGHPLLGDLVYGGTNGRYDLLGQCLHAGVLGFAHPVTGEYIECVAPLPEYFEKLKLDLF